LGFTIRKNSGKILLSNDGEVKMTISINQITNVVLDGIDMSDYPKFCDAYIVSADIDGKPATEAEIESIIEDGEIFYTLIENEIY
jgi:hypothetical protein